MQPQGSPSLPGGPPNNAQHLQYMQQYQQAQLRQQVAYMQQAMMAYPGMAPFPMPNYPGATPYMGGLTGPVGKGMTDGKGKGKFGKGGFGKGFGKGKRSGKGKKDGEGEGGEGDGEETERAPRVRRDEPPIVKAQREAREKAEADILKNLQGRWKDAANEAIIYTVEGNTCSVSNKSEPDARVFHNRLSMYGVEFCWNAKRFWHDLNLTELRAQGDAVEKVEWNPSKSSPPAEQIIWLKAPPEPEEEKADATDDGQNADAADPPIAVCSGPETTDPPATPS